MVDTGREIGQQESEVESAIHEFGNMAPRFNAISEMGYGEQGQLWIQGGAGTGKSSLVTIIIEQLRQRRNVAYFYCTDALEPLSEDSTHIAIILRALIVQLALSPDDENTVAEEVRLCYDTAESEGPLKTAEPLDREKARQLLTQLIKSRDQTTIIIDGIDECPRFVELLGVLKKVDRFTKNLKFLFSSQYVVPVDSVDYFPSTDKVVAGGKESISDMKSFIEGELQDFEELRSGLVDRKLAEDIVDTLSEKAEGMSVNMPISPPFVSSDKL
jgi:hypothetical protein